MPTGILPPTPTPNVSSSHRAEPTSPQVSTRSRVGSPSGLSPGPGMPHRNLVSSQPRTSPPTVGFHSPRAQSSVPGNAGAQAYSPAKHPQNEIRFTSGTSAPKPILTTARATPVPANPSTQHGAKRMALVNKLRKVSTAAGNLKREVKEGIKSPLESPRTPALAEAEEKSTILTVLAS